MITLDEYARRRQALMNALGPKGYAVFHAAPVIMRTESAEYPYRQTNNLLYLSGFPEPHATLVLTGDHSILFCQDRDPDKEIWTGRIIGQERARTDFGFSETYSNKEMDSLLKKITEGKTDQTAEMQTLLHEMRLIKSDAEIALMQQAASISARAHRKAMESVKPGMKEYQLAAIYEYEFKSQGATGLAYESIVGGGENACVLHYRENNETLVAGELVLVDAAGEFGFYAADITRTFPVNGEFSEPQREVYSVVLHAQQRAIEAIKPGVTWESIQEQVVGDITQGLVDLGLLKGTREQLTESKAYRRFYMHSCGHWLGLDVHDVGSYKQNDQPRKLEKNMVVTVEPGIYIQPAEDIDPRWHNIGIRIEDDVQVTHSGAHVLSWEAPKSIEAVETCMAVPNATFKL
jgi:Xaa-Pro aminopeptidase